MSIAENLKKIKGQLNQQVKLVAVSKTKPNEAIAEAYAAGQRIFGENKAQELRAKAEDLPKDIEWHMIGHLQRNKVKYLIDKVALIHGVDSMRLLAEIDKRAKKIDRVVSVLLQMHIAEEESKFGLDEKELTELFISEEFQSFENIKVCGLMGMATNTDNESQIRKEFKMLKGIFDRCKASFFQNDPHFAELSMGMSNDFQIALEEGATLVRIGSAIFGARAYH